MLISARSGQIIAYQNYSKKCKLCEVAEVRDVTPAVHRCPRNYSGSSKGMESYGLLGCVLQLWNSTNLFVRRFVIDDETTTKSQVQHSLKEMVAAGQLSRADWPKTVGGNEMKSTDGLPLEHPPVEFVADCNLTCARMSCVRVS